MQNHGLARLEMQLVASALGRKDVWLNDTVSEMRRFPMPRSVLSLLLSCDRLPKISSNITNEAMH